MSVRAHESTYYFSIRVFFISHYHLINKIFHFLKSGQFCKFDSQHSHSETLRNTLTAKYEPNKLKNVNLFGSYSVSSQSRAYWEKSQTFSLHTAGRFPLHADSLRSAAMQPCRSFLKLSFQLNSGSPRFFAGLVN